MTIPEDMMAFIEETARKAAREGAKEVVPSTSLGPVHPFGARNTIIGQ